jgi:hypothetical protein
MSGFLNVSLQMAVDKDLLQNLVSLADDLSLRLAKLDVSTIPQVAEKIKELQPNVSRFPSIYGVFIFKCLRFWQELHFLDISSGLEGLLIAGPIRSAAATFESLLMPILKVTPNLSACGKEFIRLGLDRPLISHFTANFRSEKCTGEPSADFLRVIVPTPIHKLLDHFDDVSRIPSLVKSIVSQYSTVTLFTLCDTIRYVFASPRFNLSSKSKLLLELINNIPNRSFMMQTFEIQMAICLDLLTFQRTNETDSIRAFFVVFKEFPELLFFIERVAMRNAKMRQSLAEAMAASNETLPVKNIKLPTVEIEPAVIDTVGLIQSTVRRMKWQKKDAPDILADVSEQIIKRVKECGDCTFNLPVPKNSEMSSVIASGELSIISAVCMKNADILKFTIYELGSANNHELLKGLLLDLWKSDAAGSVWPSLTTVMILLPELIKFVGGILTDVPKSVDPSCLVRYLVHNCTGDEIGSLPLVFPSIESQVAFLIKESLKWKPIPQNAFWAIVRRAYLTEEYSKQVINSVMFLIRPITESAIATAEFRLLLRKIAPSSEIWKLVNAMMKGTEMAQLIVVSVLTTWIDLFKAQTERLIQDRVSSFKSFFESLSNEGRNRFPEDMKLLIYRD